MSLTIVGAQLYVDERINRHPDGYFADDKLFEKLEEEQAEMKEALANCINTPTEENLTALKIEIGDELFALICFANSKKIRLDECFNLTMEKNNKRERNRYKKR